MTDHLPLKASPSAQAPKDTGDALARAPLFRILIPVFNDWEALSLLLDLLEAALADKNLRAEVLVVDDGSTVPAQDDYCAARRFKAIRAIEILELRRNVGHQRAIVVGLAYIEENLPCQAVIVMDADGEDDPKDVPRLIEKYEEEAHAKVVFARRTKRSERLTFRIFYGLYKAAHYGLTGTRIRIGNFSIVPAKILHRLVVVSEVWNHYSAGLLKAKIPYTEIPAKRSRRLVGQPRMNFIALVIHGLGAISVHGDTVGARAVIAMSVLIALSLLAITTVVIVRTTTDLAIPGWASFVALSIFIVMMQAILVSLIFVFMVLGGRSNMNFLPRRDYAFFVLRLRKVYPA